MLFFRNSLHYLQLYTVLLQIIAWLLVAEKLSEGIRKFAADIVRLEETFKAKLQCAWSICSWNKWQLLGTEHYRDIYIHHTQIVIHASYIHMYVCITIHVHFLNKHYLNIYIYPNRYSYLPTNIHTQRDIHTYIGTLYTNRYTRMYLHTEMTITSTSRPACNHHCAQRSTQPQGKRQFQSIQMEESLWHHQRIKRPVTPVQLGRQGCHQRPIPAQYPSTKWPVTPVHQKHHQRKDFSNWAHQTLVEFVDGIQLGTWQIINGHRWNWTIH